MRTYTLHTMTNPPIYLIKLGLEEPPHKVLITVEAKSKKAAVVLFQSLGHECQAAWLS